MRAQDNIKKVICFGEILWDNLPTGRKAGGAPMNVAYHLRKMGADASMISRIGADKAGADLIAFTNEIGLPDNLIQIDEHQKTSEVIATIGEGHEVIYEILYPVAWDFIIWKPVYEDILKETDAFVFGSLAARNEVSRNTLFKMLECSAYNVFDVNLRAPHYQPEIIEQLLHKTHLLKLNIAELMLLAEWFSCPQQEEEAVKVIQDRFGIEDVIVTKGSRGASFNGLQLRYDYPIYPVEVADTVGSGDSFLAAFLAKKLEGECLEISLDYASALAAFVTTHSGACPAYNLYDLERFIWEKKKPIEILTL